MSILRLSFRSFLNLFLPPVTVAFPFKPREYPAATRGALGIDIASCIYCGACARTCPAKALKVDRAEKTWTIESFRCVSCNACVECCPKDCLELSNQPPSCAGAEQAKANPKGRRTERGA